MTTPLDVARQLYDVVDANATADGSPGWCLMAHAVTVGLFGTWGADDPAATHFFAGDLASVELGRALLDG